MKERIDTLRSTIGRYRRYLEEGASRTLAAHYLQAINEAQEEIAAIEDRMRIPELPEGAPPEPK